MKQYVLSIYASQSLACASQAATTWNQPSAAQPSAWCAHFATLLCSGRERHDPA